MRSSPPAAPRSATRSTAPKRIRRQRARRSPNRSRLLALSDPRPLSVAAVQALLQGDEALVAILVGSNKSFVWAVTRERAEWAQIDAGSGASPGMSRCCAVGSIRRRRRTRRSAGQPARGRAGLRLQPRARALQAGAGSGGAGVRGQAPPDRRAHRTIDQRAVPGVAHRAAGAQERPREAFATHRG